MEANSEPESKGLINGSIDNESVLSEDALRQLSKTMTKIIPHSFDGLEKSTYARTQSLLQNILQTASSTRLFLPHGAAALNALCCLLEQCSSSVEDAFRDLVYKTETWTRAFNIYLTKANKHKSKPLRRLLLTMTRLLFKLPVGSEKASLIEIPVCIATRAIYKQDDFADIRPSIQLLEHFIGVGLISALEIAQINRPEGLGLSQVKSMRLDSQSHDTQQDHFIKSVHRFIFSILEWMQYPDCAPAVGQLLPVFLKSIEESRIDGIIQTSKDGITPYWVSPIEQMLECHQELWEVFEIHILPNLLRLGPSDAEAFIRMLPFESIQRGDISSSSNAEMRLCLLVARIATQDSSLKSSFVQGQSTLPDSDNLGITLLEHSASDVRLAALSLVISSSASTRPFCSQVLHRLRQCVPYFHVEVNAKSRNEYIALMKKLCARLQGATLSLLRRSHDPDSLAREQVTTATHSVTGVNHERLLSSGNAIEKALDDKSQDLEEHLAFRKWYMSFLLRELRPTSSYQSHITALKILEILLEQTVALRNTSSRSQNDYLSALNESLPGGLFLRPLTELLFDPFDDVRQTANRVIDLCLSTYPNLQIRWWTDLKKDSIGQAAKHPNDSEDEHYKANDTILFDLNQAENTAGITGRADHADGLGRLYNILFTTSNAVAKPDGWLQSSSSIVDHVISTLDKDVDIAKNDLLYAVGDIPLHGHLIALRYIVSRTDYVELLDGSLVRWEGFDQRIFSICSGIWEVVHDILCSDAPEGHDISEGDVSEQDPGTKDTLSFCWRALKESSLLMHAMVTNISYVPPSFRNATEYEGYYIIGHQSFTQLAELRHRGAFSTVSLTFATCCVMCARSSQLTFREHPKTWYKLALKSIEDNASSLTRRSAGIPAIVTGVLAAYLGDNFFDDVVVTLQAMANTPVGADLGSLPQVHALNCLKDIFTDARFGPNTERFVAEALETAASCLESQIWNIRNCGLMLFKALLKRLNGGTDTSSTKASSSRRRSSLLTYEKYPNLPDLLVRLLRRDHAQLQLTGKELQEAVQAHRVFPALEVIERFGIPIQHHGAVLDALWYYNESPNWSIREKAAKSLSLIVGETRIVEEVTSLLAPIFKTQNALHGRLLQLRFLLARNEAPLFGELLITYESIARPLEDSFDKLATRNACPITTATFLDCLVDLYTILLMSDSEKSESLLLLILAVQQKTIAKSPASALLMSPLRRSSTLANYVHALKNRPQSSGSAESPHHLAKADMDALQVVNVAAQNMSDENDLAILRFCSARELRWASDITQCSGMSKKLPSNPRQSDYALALQGYTVGKHYASDDTNTEFQSWILLLSEAGAEHTDLRTRTAAVFSIRAFFDGLLDHDFQVTLDPQILGVYLALYDSLVDDDEDVRDQGARIVSIVLSPATALVADRGTTTLSPSPPAAKERLLQFLCKGYRDSKLLCVESVRRLIGLDSVRNSASAFMQNEKSLLHFRPVVDLLLESQTTSTVVFVEERQNLYIDSVSEAECWADILSRLDLEALPLSIASELETWTVEGLGHFLESLQDGTDGALSPTSKPEVFGLYTRVLLAAKILILRHGGEVGKGKEHICVQLLQKLLHLGRRMLVHDLILHRIETILMETGSLTSGSGELPQQSVDV